MNRRHSSPARPSPPALLGLVLASTVATVASPLKAERSDTRPNIMVVLCDDLGYGDLACYGHKLVRTPHIDTFASEGLRLTNCYAAAANCSPARAGLMTGRTPYRVGIHNWIPMGSPMHVQRREITVATLLRQAGYTTCHVGKWHLNGLFNAVGQPQPSDHGFDHWFSTQNNALPNHRDPDNFVRNSQPVGKLKGYSAGLVVDEAVAWLRARDKDRPFFQYVCFHEPHEPIATDPTYTKLYPSEDPSFAAHHGNITQMDTAFGRLMKFLDASGLRENTLVFFTSDNGPAITSIHPHGSSGPLRDKKGSLWEGGIRVPGLVRWPGRTTPGSETDVPVCGVDLLPTLCDVAQIPPPADRALDGTSFVPLLGGQPMRRERSLYWQFNYAPRGPRAALRRGDWKIVGWLSTPDIRPGVDIDRTTMQTLKSAELARFELYNLKTDIAEQTDLSQREPERAARLISELRASYAAVRDESPVWPDWTWPRYESQRIEWPEYRQSRKR